MANLLADGRITRERAQAILNSAYYSIVDWAPRQMFADLLFTYFQPKTQPEPVQLAESSADSFDDLLGVQSEQEAQQ